MVLSQRIERAGVLGAVSVAGTCHCCMKLCEKYCSVIIKSRGSNDNVNGKGQVELHWFKIVVFSSCGFSKGNNICCVRTCMSDRTPSLGSIAIKLNGTGVLAGGYWNLLRTKNDCEMFKDISRDWKMDRRAGRCLEQGKLRGKVNKASINGVHPIGNHFK